MSKVYMTVLHNCIHCPANWAGEECTKLDRYFTDDEIEANTTPSWCPLPDAKEGNEMSNESCMWVEISDGKYHCDCCPKPVIYWKAIKDKCPMCGKSLVLNKLPDAKEEE